MRTITKGPEPRSLTAHRNAPHSDYANYPVSEDLRRALVSEQRRLCCYCMGRIRPDRKVMKIEHWRCQVHYRDKELSYGNLLAACLGGSGQPRNFQHCDTRKGNSDLQWNPADPAHQIETRVCYGLDGAIRSGDTDFNEQLNEVLNLNLRWLKNNRKSMLTAVLDWWKHEKARTQRPVQRGRFLRKRNEQIAGDGALEPYSPVAVWWIDQRLARMSA